MNEYKGIFLSLLKRALIAVPLFALGLALLFRAEGGLVGAFALGLIGCAAIVLAAVVLAVPLARLAAEPFGNLYFPDARFERPPPLYGIPESRRAKGRYEEAMAGYERIASDYPEEARPYVEMIAIAIVNLKDPARANAIFQRGISRLPGVEEKETLARMYGAIRTRLDARPAPGEAPPPRAPVSLHPENATTIAKEPQRKNA